MKKRCSVHGCRHPARTKGYCNAHYLRRLTGKPLEGRIRKRVVGSIGKRMRAHRKIDKETGCHLWTGYRDEKGYGHMVVDGLTRGAHRIAWELTNGPIPEGMEVMRAVCDNPGCCNPAHLKLGTHTDNMRDRVRKGRGPGARERDLELHPQWAKRPARRQLARLPPSRPETDHVAAPARSPPLRDLQPGESAPSGSPWASGQVALWLLEVSLAPGAVIGPVPETRLSE
jgi:hypothetical protein